MSVIAKECPPVGSAGVTPCRNLLNCVLTLNPMTIEHVDIFFQIVVFLFAISVHESAHAWTALRRGDATAYMLGRVTLNPLKHIDPIGTVLLPALALLTHFPLIGWAKPTPVNTRNFKNLVLDDVLTSVAGPVSNFMVATIATLLLLGISLSSPLGREIVTNRTIGSITESTSLLMPFVMLLYDAMLINVLLGLFNLIPIPPLDGSHVLRHFLPYGAQRAYDAVGMFGLLLLFTVGGRMLRIMMDPVVNTINALLTRF